MHIYRHGCWYVNKISSLSVGLVPIHTIVYVFSAGGEDNITHLCFYCRDRGNWELKSRIISGKRREEEYVHRGPTFLCWRGVCDLVRFSVPYLSLHTLKYQCAISPQLSIISHNHVK